MSADYSLYLDSKPENEDYTIPLFSVPLFHYKVENWEEKKVELLKLYEERQKSNEIKCSSGAHALDVETDYHSNSDNSFNYSDAITDIFEDELVDFANQTNLEISVNSTWFERASKYKHQTLAVFGPLPPSHPSPAG